MSVQESVVSDEVGNLNEASMDQLGCTSAIQLPPIVGNITFHVSSTTL